MDELDIEVAIQFNEVDYIASATVLKQGNFDPDYKLLIDMEEASTGHIWRGQFHKEYIEEITNKAGNFKKFMAFVKLIEQAINRRDPKQVYIDLLTQSDLAALKARKQGLAAPSAPQQNQDPRGKRYLIMTLFGEYEKVHYPMPLSYLEQPDIAILRKTFSRMHSAVQLQNSQNHLANSQQQLDASDSYNQSFGSNFEFQTNSLQNRTMDDFYLIESQNQQMREEIEAMERQFAQTMGDGFFEVNQAYEQAESLFDAERQEAERQMQILAKEVQYKEAELSRLQNQLNKARTTQMSGFSLQNSLNNSVADAESVKLQLSQMQKEMDQECANALKMMQETDGEKEKIDQNIAEQKENEIKMKARMNQLQDELEKMIKQIDKLQKGNGGFGSRANARMNFGGGSNQSAGSRNSSNNSRGIGYSNNRVNSNQKYTSPQTRAQNSNVPSYMRARGAASNNASQERSGSGSRAQYVPIHLRPKPQVQPRVSPGAGPRYGANNLSNNRTSPNQRPSPNTRPGGSNGRQPYIPGQNNSGSATRQPYIPGQNNSGASNNRKISPGLVQGNRFGVDYTGKVPRGIPGGRYNSNQRVPQVNNFLRKGNSPGASAERDQEQRGSGVFNRLYDRAAKRSTSREQDQKAIGTSATQAQSRPNISGAPPKPLTQRGGAPPKAAVPPRPSAQQRSQPQQTSVNLTAVNKENKPVQRQSSLAAMQVSQHQQQQQQTQPRQASLNNADRGSTDNLDQKLSRLQNLIQMAKN